MTAARLPATAVTCSMPMAACGRSPTPRVGGNVVSAAAEGKGGIGVRRDGVTARLRQADTRVGWGV
jgi:hypothetical protein